MSLVSNISYRCWHVWRRNFDVSLVTWKTNVFPPLLEPLLYFFAFGLGLGVYVEKIRFNGQLYDYLTFLAPGMIAVGVMFHALFESMYGSFVRMRYQKTFEATLCTPLLIEDILAGEILWGATKGLFAGAAVLLVTAAFNLVTWPHSLIILPVSAIAGVMFSGFGLYFAAISPYIDNLNLPTFLFVNPMFLFSGTFFPLTGMPAWVQGLAWILPLTHVVNIMRAAALGSFTRDLWIGFAYILVLSLAVSWLAMARMKRRLIK